MGARNVLGWSWNSVVEGVVIGVTVAIVLGVYQYGRALIKRHNQMRYFRSIVSDAKEQMNKSSNLEIIDISFSADEVRHTLFVKMYNDVKSALAGGGADRLRHKERHQLEQALWTIDLFVSRIKEVSPGVQEELFEEFEKVKWLKISASKR